MSGASAVRISWWTVPYFIYKYGIIQQNSNRIRDTSIFQDLRHPTDFPKIVSDKPSYWQRKGDVDWLDDTADVASCEQDSSTYRRIETWIIYIL
jgi:hypothetical protein